MNYMKIVTIEIGFAKDSIPKPWLFVVYTKEIRDEILQGDDIKLGCPLFFLGLTNSVTNVNAKGAMGGGGILGCRVQFQH